MVRLVREVRIFNVPVMMATASMFTESSSNNARLLSKAACIVVLIMLSSCGGRKNAYEQIPRLHGTVLESKRTMVELEKVQLDSVHCSGESISGVTPSGRIFYYDIYFCWLYEFNTDGTLAGRYMGYGRGPEESMVKQCVLGSMSKDGEFALMGGSLDFEYFTKDHKVINYFMITKSRDDSSPEDFLTYSNPVFDASARLYDGKMYMGMTSDNPAFAYFFTNTEYLENSYRIGIVDLKSGEALPMAVKGFPSVYESDPYKYTSFDCVDFDIDNEGNMYLGFQADSSIYVFDKEFRTKFAFGVAGSAMDLSYNKIQTESDLPFFMENIETKGYYSRIEYIDETGICFRSYKKGSHAQYDGLQIYKDGDLIGDCEVPKSFKVTGYVAPYYYSQVFNGDDDGELMMYRFRL